MFTNSVLFNAGGISFTLVKCFLVAGVILVGVSALLFAILFKHSHGVVTRMSPDEAARAQVYGMRQSWDDIRDPVAWVGAAGATGRSVEIHFDIDSLRNAHRRGDRMTFWLSPIMFTCWALAFWLVFIAAMMAADVPYGFQIMVTVFLFLFILIPWFAAWAAVNTNIDLGKAGSGNRPAAASHAQQAPTDQRQP